MHKRQICYVRWIDSSILAGQHEPHESTTPTVIESVGFVVAETQKYITLTRDIHDDADHRGSLSIPKVAIQKIRNLKR